MKRKWWYETYFLYYSSYINFEVSQSLFFIIIIIVFFYIVNYVLSFSQAHPKHEQFLNKKIEMYDEMAIVVGKDMATGSFSKSFADIDDSEHVDLDFDDASSKEKDVASSNSASAKRSHRKRSRADSEDTYSSIAEQLKDVALALRSLNKGVDADYLYEEVMKVEGYDEFMLASAFDHLIGDENVTKRFLAKNAKLKKFWLDNFFKNHGA
jgi:hypothetical protein